MHFLRGAFRLDNRTAFLYYTRVKESLAHHLT